MRAIALILGMMILFYGCTAPPQAGPSTQAPTVQQPAAPAAQTCSDGTPYNSCSSNQPFYCTSSGTLEENPSLCGCPEGAILQDNECISECEDGTPLSTCSTNKPYYCNQYGSMVEKPSLCGCPTGTVRSGESCIQTCLDGTLPGECSELKPRFCTVSLELIDDPERCGCPTGKLLKDGVCVEAKCIDGTPVGECSIHMLPTYCNEDLLLVRNPSVCGCLSDEILSEDGSRCLNPDELVYDEGDNFKVFGDAYMRFNEAEWVECSTGEYIRVQLRVDNSDGDDPYSLYKEEIKLYYEPSGSSTGTWISVEYPSHDGTCVEDDKFAWTYTMPGDVNVGMVWFLLPGPYDSHGEYSVFYEHIRIELDPD